MAQPKKQIRLDPQQFESSNSPRLNENKSNVFHSKVESRNVDEIKSTLSKEKIQNKFKKNKTNLKKRINRTGFVTQNEPENQLNAGQCGVETRRYPMSKCIANGIQNSPIGLQDMPAEILTKIFVQLSSRERKNVKLVSKNWYESCNVFPILHSEKIVCLGVYELSKIIQTLIDSKLKYMNLEFRETNFCVDTDQFWRQCGCKIRSLRFVKCDLNDQIIRRMLKYCNHLQEVSFKHMKNKGWSVRDVWVKVWENLIEDKIIAPSVTTLEVHHSDDFISDHVINFMFKVFPNVKNFTLCCNSIIITSDSSEIESVLVQQYSKKDITHDGLRDILRRREHSFERLHIEYSPDCFLPIFWNYFVTDLHHTTRLKEITFSLLDIGNPNIIDLLARQECIEKVKCIVADPMGSLEDLNGFLFALFKCCPHLRHFQLEISENCLELNWATLNLLLKSCLETLYIKTTGFIVYEDVMLLDSLPENHTLRFLKFGAADNGLNMCFVQKFCNLKHLSFSPSFVNDEVIQDIWKYQTGLISLVLNSYDCPEYVFTGCDEESHHLMDKSDESVTYSIRRLEKLEYLKITLTFEGPRCTSKVFKHFCFPHLRFLNVTLLGYEAEHIPAFLECVKRLTSLERIHVFYTGYNRISFHDWGEVCGNLEKLRYLRIESHSRELNDSEYKGVFNRCPSLRVLQHIYYSDGPDNIVEWYFDVFKNKPVRETCSNICHVYPKKMNFSFFGSDALKF